MAPGDLAQYWEYCHLVPAKGLRTAYDSLLDGRCGQLQIYKVANVMVKFATDRTRGSCR
jgi:hypothetical protein